MNITALFFALATAFAVISVAFSCFYLLLRRPRAKVSARLTPVNEVSEYESDNDSPLVRLFANSGQRMERWLQDDDESTALMLTRAGWRDGRLRSMFYVLQFALPTIGVAAVLLLGVSVEKITNLQMFLFGFAAFAAGILIPRNVLRSAARNRQARIRSEVPLFVHLLVLLYEAGLSTRQAMQSLVREGQGVLPELGAEFKSALRQLDAGADLVEILADIECELAVNELSNVLGVLRQVERYGGEVRESLLSALAVIEERRTLTLRERVNHMAGRMTVVMVMFFFPALLLCVAGPAFTAVIMALRGATS